MADRGCTSYAYSGETTEWEVSQCHVPAWAGCTPVSTTATIPPSTHRSTGQSASPTANNPNHPQKTWQDILMKKGVVTREQVFGAKGLDARDVRT